MNKKFSTLMAGLMLASAFSVADAQKVVEKYETNKAYWLGISEDGTFDMTNDGTAQVIAVVSNPKAANYGQLILVNKAVVMNDICAIKAATWTITFTQPTDGTAPKFTYVNKATGLTLSLDPDDAGKIAMIKGGSSEWLNSSVTNADTNKKDGDEPIAFAPLRSFYKANEAVVLKKGVEATSTELVKDLFGTTVTETPIPYTKLTVDVKKGNDVQDFQNVIEVAPVQPMILPLDEKALNSQLGKLDLSVVSDDQKWFNLYFNQDVTDGAQTNLFSATKLKAKQVEKDGKPTPYVMLFKDKVTYITVDTAYHVGTETVGALPKFTYATDSYEGTNNVARLKESAEFAFAYNPFTDAILIKSHAYYKKSSSKTPFKITGADGNDAYTYWGYSADNTEDASLKEEKAYIRLAKLASVRELTVAESNGVIEQADLTTSAGWGYNYGLTGMSTTVKISQDDLTFTPSTIADGLYMIKLHTSGYDRFGDKRSEANGDYLIASLAGNFGYAEQAKNQNYDHMPAAQWYVKQNGSSTTAPVTITNREFGDKILNAENFQLFNAGDGRVFFTGSNSFANDTLEFIPVSAASKKDSKLGYKYVDEKQASVETYYFNYLSGLAQDKGLNTPSDKDSLVRVDETGDKIALRLIPVVKDDSYGIQLDEKETGVANLIRNAYYIEAYDNLKFAADGRSRYLSYEPSSKKYVMTTVPTAFFLKENNDIDGTHYYALVDANLYGYNVNVVLLPKITVEDGNTTKTLSCEWAKGKDKDNQDVELWKLMYPAKYAGRNALKENYDVWSYGELADKKIVDEKEFKSPLTQQEKDNLFVPFYNKNGEPIIADASEAVELYAYMEDLNDNVIKLTQLKGQNGSATVYYAMNPDAKLYQRGILTARDGDATYYSGSKSSSAYASSRISVDDNTLDLFKAVIGNNNWQDELRVSAFEAQVNDSPLYRRFNGANGEYGTSANAPLNLKFFRHNNNAEYLFENYASENEYRDGINDKEISFLGVNNAFQFPESETRSYTMFVDTAYVRANTRMPQYLIGIRPEVVLGDTTLCDATTHQHKTPEEALACEHTKINVGFTRAMYLFNAQDSVDVKNYDYQGKAAYGAQGYTRLAFKDAVHANDTLYILNPNVTTEELKACNLKNDKLFAKKIALDNNKHKNVVFQFRLVTDEDNRFLIESEAEENGKAVFNKDLKNVSVAPMRGGWVKIQNGVPVIARFDDFNEAIAQAEIFDVNDEIKYDATANDEVAVEAVKVIAGNGQVTIMGAAGKNVTITNILGKVIASQVIASDNATIAVPAGIVAVAVEGEAAVKAIVK